MVVVVLVVVIYIERNVYQRVWKSASINNWRTSIDQEEDQLFDILWIFTKQNYDAKKCIAWTHLKSSAAKHSSRTRISSSCFQSCKLSPLHEWTICKCLLSAGSTVNPLFLSFADSRSIHHYFVGFLFLRSARTVGFSIISTQLIPNLHDFGSPTMRATITHYSWTWSECDGDCSVFYTLLNAYIFSLFNFYFFLFVETAEMGRIFQSKICEWLIRHAIQCCYWIMENHVRCW